MTEALLPGHLPWRESINAMAVTREGDVVSGSGDGTIRLHDGTTGQETSQVRVRTEVRALALLPDDQVAVVDTAGTLYRVNPRTREIIAESAVEAAGEAVWVMAAAPDGSRIVTAGKDGGIRVWTGADLTAVAAVPDGHDGPVYAVAVTPDCRQIVSGGRDMVVRIWDLSTGAQAGELAGHTRPVNALAVTPDGSTIVSGGRDRTVRVWRRATGEPVGEPLAGHRYSVTAVAVTPDGRHAVTGGGNGEVHAWHLATGDPNSTPLPASGYYSVKTIAISPDGTQVYVLNNGRVEVISRVAGRAPVFTARPHRRAVSGVAFAPDGTRFYSVGRDSALCAGATDGAAVPWKRRHAGSALYGLAISADGAWLSTAGRGGVTWHPTDGDGDSGQRMTDDAPAYAVAITSDNKRVVSAHGSGRLRVWEPATNVRVELPDEVERRGAVYAIAITPDDRLVVSANQDGVIMVRDLQTGAPVRAPITGHRNPFQAVAITPDGRRLACGFDDGTIRVVDLTGQDADESISAHDGPVYAVAVTPDGRLIVSAGADGAVRMWDATTGRQYGDTLVGHHGAVYRVAVSRDGDRILAGGEDGTVRVWSIATEERVNRTERSADVLTDAESTEDRLGIAGDVHTMAALLASVSTVPPLSVAVLGDWGSGKSTFMRLVADRIDALSIVARTRRQAGHVRSVRQIRFNAWHYSDDHLWTGLVEQLFRGLREPAAGPSAADNADRVAKLEADLATLRAGRHRLDRALSDVDELDPDRGWWGWLGQLRRGLVVLRAARREAQAQFRLRAAVTGLLLLLAAAGVVVAGTYLGQALLGWLTGIGVLAGGVLARIRELWTRVNALTESARTRLLADQHAREQKIHAVEDELNRLDPVRRLDTLLAEITSTDRYESYRGLTGRIHHDLLRLSEETAGNAGTPQRIILYIDDLDRCVSSRVVEVLQAVNLLLTMPMFMVVVAVDPRWLLRALHEHHGKLLNAQNTEHGRPLDYLDKIFHVPYAIRPVGPYAADFLRSLLPDAEPDPRPTASAGPSDRGPVPAPRRRPYDDVASARTPEPQEDPVFRRSPDFWYTATATVEVTSESLRLRRSETDFLPLLAPLLHTPRAVKKFANLYRLMRTAVPDAEVDAFIGGTGGGPYQAAALLLATVVSNPGQADDLLSTVIRTPQETTIGQSLRDLELPAAARLADLIEDIGRTTEVTTDIEYYRTWAGRVARYSFETYHLFTA